VQLRTTQRAFREALLALPVSGCMISATVPHGADVRVYVRGALVGLCGRDQKKGISASERKFTKLWVFAHPLAEPVAASTMRHQAGNVLRNGSQT
jgi:hypothetical protein